MDNDANGAIAALLRETEAAHGEYERTVLAGERDDDWPSWYATFLLENGLGGLVPGAAVDASTLATTLAQLDEDFRRERPAVSWHEFYARRLLAHHV